MSAFPNQDRTTVKSGKSIDEAIETALRELGAQRESVDIEIIQEPSKGFLGFGGKPALVKVTVNVPEEPEAAEETHPEEAAAQPRQRSNQRNRGRHRGAQRSKNHSREHANGEAPEAVGTVKPFVPTTFDIPSHEDSPVEAAKIFLTSMFAAMQIDVTADVELEADMMTVNLAGDNMGIVIGKRGDTLDSIQYLTSLVVNRRNKGDYIKVTIDTENYREKRADALVALSNRLADKVARSGKKFTLEPMNPYERRIIHANLQDNENVSTFSVGSEPYRKVVIAPKHGSKPRYDKRGGRHQQAPKHDAPKAEKTGSYTTTYKADFHPTPHKAEYHSYEEYLAAQNGDIIPPVKTDDED